MDFLLTLEAQGRKASTISRFIASAKAFFAWQSEQGLRKDNPAKDLKAPKIEKKPPEILTEAEIGRLLDQPSSAAPKELRDKAMMELLYATGIRVSELISLELSDVNLKLEYLVCRDAHKERTLPFGGTAKDALENYLEKSRPRGECVVYAALYKLLRRADEQTGLLEDCEILRQAGGTWGRDYAAYAAAFLCGASARKRGGFEVRAGADGAFGYLNDAGVHAVIGSKNQGSI